jgi:AcrR family transcriptional regulator
MVASTSLGSASGMVATPWGTSESLRAKSLRPGPGNRPEEVARNQRERIFGAMVATVAGRGYGSTRVSDLVKLSGVSRRTFYDLFEDKETCFLETVQAVLKLSRVVSAVVDAEAAAKTETWEERALLDFRHFAAMVVAQPAAARVVLIEAYGAGDEVLKLLDDEMGHFEGLVQRSNIESPGRTAMPPEMVTAHVGALQEIARNRLGSGTESELPGLIDEVAQLILSYPPPPEPIRFATRLAAARDEDLGAHNHAERAARAMAVVVAEKGYAQTTIDEVIARASMSASTFYANFAGKDDALLAAIDGAGAQAAAAVLPAFERNPDWPSAIRAAFGAFFDFLATRPALAHLLSVGVYGAGPTAIRRRARALAPLQELVARGGAERRPRPTAIELEVFGGAVFGLMYRQVRKSGPESLPALAPIGTYLALTPFIGPEEACEAANGDGRARRRPAKQGQDDDASSRTVPERGEAPGGSRRALPGEESEAESEGEPTAVALVDIEAQSGVESESLESAAERHLSKVTLRIDRRGWNDLIAIGEQAEKDALEVQRQSEERLAQNDETEIEVRAMHLLLPSPPSPAERRQVIAAAKNVIAKRGFQATSAGNIAIAASIGLDTFYALFNDTDECLIAVYDEILRDVRNEISAALPAEGDWADRVLAGLHAVLHFIAAEPLAARIALAEVQTGGPEAAHRYGATLDEIVESLRGGRSARPGHSELPPHFEGSIASGLIWLLQGRLERAELDEVGSLFREMAKVTLEPYLGADEADKRIEQFHAGSEAGTSSGGHR